jgi:HMG (high mobility group) box
MERILHSPANVVPASSVQPPLDDDPDILFIISDPSDMARTIKNRQRLEQPHHTGSEDHVPRPPNSFIIYRNDNAHHYSNLSATLLSVALAKRWRDEPPSIRSRYNKLAELERISHIKKYPDYKFRPRKKTTATHRPRPSAEKKPQIKKPSPQSPQPSPPSPQPSLSLAIPQISSPELNYQYQLLQWALVSYQDVESSLRQESLFADISPYQEDDIKLLQAWKPQCAFLRHHDVFLS